MTIAVANPGPYVALKSSITWTKQTNKKPIWTATSMQKVHRETQQKFAILNYALGAFPILKEHLKIQRYTDTRKSKSLVQMSE